MRVKEKMLLDFAGLKQHGAINIVIFGDSVSHGAVNGYFDYENVYWNVLQKKLHAFRDYMPINMINASIGGTAAKSAVERMEDQVFCHRPDLVIVCFGLNDVNGTLEGYLDPMRQIFERCIKEGCEAIFLTPNMLNTYVTDDTLGTLREYATKTAEMQNSGKMDTFIYAAIDMAKEMGIKVCDCYSKWKRLAQTQDTTMLLANRVNHPIPEMHKLFADELYEMIIEDQKTKVSDSSMYKGD